MFHSLSLQHAQAAHSHGHVCTAHPCIVRPHPPHPPSRNGSRPPGGRRDPPMALGRPQATAIPSPARLQPGPACAPRLQPRAARALRPRLGAAEGTRDHDLLGDHEGDIHLYKEPQYPSPPSAVSLAGPPGQTMSQLILTASRAGTVMHTAGTSATTSPADKTPSPSTSQTTRRPAGLPRMSDYGGVDTRGGGCRPMSDSTLKYHEPTQWADTTEQLRGELVRVHVVPRRRLYWPPEVPHGTRRITEMCTEEERVRVQREGER